jgi:hypothetical protein
MKSLSNFLPLMLEMSQYNEVVCEGACFAAWNIVAGPKLARVSQPERLINKTLIVLLPDETWKEQVTPMVESLIGQINFLLGRVLVKKVDLRVQATAFNFAANRPQTEVTPIDPTIAEAAAQITDPGLRELYIKAATSALEARARPLLSIDPQIAEVAAQITNPKLRQLYIETATRALQARVQQDAMRKIL